MNEKSLSINDVNKLKTAGLLFEHETALKIDDMIIAINQLTNSRRIVQASGLMLECTRKLLCD